MLEHLFAVAERDGAELWIIEYLVGIGAQHRCQGGLMANARDQCHRRHCQQNEPGHPPPRHAPIVLLDTMVVRHVGGLLARGVAAQPFTSDPSPSSRE